MLLAQIIDLDYSLESLFLLPFWLVADCYALFIGICSVSELFKKQVVRWRALKLGVFPLVFGGCSLLLIHSFWAFDRPWWIYSLALVPCAFGAVGIVGALVRIRA